MPRLITNLEEDSISIVGKSHTPSMPTEGIYSVSSLEAFEKCPRFFALKYIEGLTPKAEDEEALRYGSAIHWAFDRLSKGEKANEVAEQFVEMYRDAFASTGVNRSLATALRLILEYETDVSPFQRGELVDSEIDFAASIDEGRYPFALIGRIDRVWKIDNDIYLRDWKTTTVFGSDYWNQFELSNQICAYLLAYELLTGVRPAGMYIDCLRITKDPIKAKRNSPTGAIETAYPSRCFRVHPQALQDWKLRMLKKVERIDSLHFWNLKIPLTSNKYPFEGVYSSCTSKYNKKCIFHQLCCNWHNEEAVRSFMEADFQRRDNYGKP